MSIGATQAASNAGGRLAAKVPFRCCYDRKRADRYDAAAMITPAAICQRAFDSVLLVTGVGNNSHQSIGARCSNTLTRCHQKAVGGGDELRGELLHLGVGPDRLSGDHAVVSGASQGMTVHRPEQDGPIGLPRLVDRDVERLTPGDLQVALLLDLGTDIVTPPLERLIVQHRHLPQRGDRGQV